MSRIDLTNGYFIDIDPMCFTLKKKYKGTKKGEEKDCESVHGYFGSIGQAVEKFLHLNKIDKMADKAVSMREYVELVEKIDNEAVRAIQRAWRSLGGGKE